MPGQERPAPPSVTTPILQLLMPIRPPFRRKIHQIPKDLAGPAVNVAQAYARYAADLRDGTRLCADFDDAVRRHRMIAAIEESAASGRRVSMEQG